MPKKWIVVCCGVMVLINSLAADFQNRSPFNFHYHEKTSEILSHLQSKRIFVVSPLWAFFSGTFLYMDNEKVFRADNICHHVEEWKQADYVLIYRDVVLGVGMYDNIRSAAAVEEPCVTGLKSVTRFLLSTGHEFDLYEVVK